MGRSSDGGGRTDAAADSQEATIMSVRPGMPAPDFETKAYVNGDFSTVKLAEYRGKWVVLFFYPANFTFVCPTELVAVAAGYKQIKSLDCEVLAISIDTHFSHKVWQETELSKMIPGGLPYPMLSDLGGKIGQLYGVFDEKLGLDLRGTFIIDPDGVLQATQILNAPVGREFDELVREIQAFQHVRNMKGAEACPTGWKPGKQTLKPGTSLVGKVADTWKLEKR
jgi:NADH-dependent peroxiredoxin subunit C